MNGSSDTGHCSNVSNNGVTSYCTDPTSSVLFDGVIPTLTGLDGDMWASQLLTLYSTGSITAVVFAFSITDQLIESLSVELVIFNCPEWGISVQSIRFGNSVGKIIGSSGDLNSITSCDSLVRLCVPETDIHSRVVFLEFDLGTDSNWVHLAEVTFYNDSTTCPPDTIINTDLNATPTNTPSHPATPTTTTTATLEMTKPPSHITTQEEATPNAELPTTGTSKPVIQSTIGNTYC